MQRNLQIVIQELSELPIQGLKLLVIKYKVDTINDLANIFSEKIRSKKSKMNSEVEDELNLLDEKVDEISLRYYGLEKIPDL